MFGIDSSELAIIALVALLVIGPKDLPRVMRKVGQWVSKGRAMSRHVRAGFDTMMRESELEEMQKQWAAQNEAIMKATALPDLNSPDLFSPDPYQPQPALAHDGWMQPEPPISESPACDPPVDAAAAKPEPKPRARRRPMTTLPAAAVAKSGTRKPRTRKSITAVPEPSEP